MTVHPSKQLLLAPMGRKNRRNRRYRRDRRGRHSQLLPQPAFRLMLCLQMLFILGGLSLLSFHFNQQFCHSRRDAKNKDAL